jgi:hypothetical protein
VVGRRWVGRYRESPKPADLTLEQAAVVAVLGPRCFGVVLSQSTSADASSFTFIGESFLNPAAVSWVFRAGPRPVTPTGQSCRWSHCCITPSTIHTDPRDFGPSIVVK